MSSSAPKRSGKKGVSKKPLSQHQQYSNDDAHSIYQRAGKEIVREGKVSEPLGTIGSNPVCYCGQVSVVVVDETETNVGRRFFGCEAFNDHMNYPDVIDCCCFKEWTDPPICERGRQYALEAQAEIRRLSKINAGKTRDGPFPKPW